MSHKEQTIHRYAVGNPRVRPPVRIDCQLGFAGHSENFPRVQQRIERMVEAAADGKMPISSCDLEILVSQGAFALIHLKAAHDPPGLYLTRYEVVSDQEESSDGTR